MREKVDDEFFSFFFSPSYGNLDISSHTCTHKFIHTEDSNFKRIKYTRIILSRVNYVHPVNFYSSYIYIRILELLFFLTFLLILEISLDLSTSLHTYNFFFFFFIFLSFLLVLHFTFLSYLLLSITKNYTRRGYYHPFILIRIISYLCCFDVFFFFLSLYLSFNNSKYNLLRSKSRVIFFFNLTIPHSTLTSLFLISSPPSSPFCEFTSHSLLLN